MAVGHKWVLVKNGEEASVREGRPNGVTLASKSSFSSQFMGTATELEALREALQQREEQVASCQATIQQLELTRDRSSTCSQNPLTYTLSSSSHRSCSSLGIQ